MLIFLEYDIKKTLELGYGQSIHKIEDPEIIKQIFGLYADTSKQIEILSLQTKQKNINEKLIEVSASYLRTAIHNKIQQNLYEKLVIAFGVENVRMEEDYVDLVLVANDKVTLIEVKPYNSARQCIIEGLGQLLNYYDRSTYKKELISLIIIGNQSASEDDAEFIKFIKSTLHIPFDYMGWTEMCMPLTAGTNVSSE